MGLRTGEFFSGICGKNACFCKKTGLGCVYYDDYTGGDGVFCDGYVGFWLNF